MSGSVAAPMPLTVEVGKGGGDEARRVAGVAIGFPEEERSDGAPGVTPARGADADDARERIVGGAGGALAARPATEASE